MYRIGQKRPRAVGLLAGYADANFVGDIGDLKYTTGTIKTYNGYPVACDSLKQTFVATSTAEAEYIAISEGLQRAKFLKAIITETWLTNNFQVTIHTENQASHRILKRLSGTKRHKYIDLRHHFIQDTLRTHKFAI